MHRVGAHPERATTNRLAFLIIVELVVLAHERLLTRGRHERVEVTTIALMGPQFTGHPLTLLGQCEPSILGQVTLSHPGDESRRHGLALPADRPAVSIDEEPVVVDSRHSHAQQTRRNQIVQAVIVAIEDLNVAGMANRKRHLGRALADVSPAELRRQLTYKMADRGTTLVVVDRFFPSSKTCSACGAVRAKLPLSVRVFECSTCGATLDRDVNASLNIEAEGRRLLTAALDAVSRTKLDVAGLRPETRNADPRTERTGVLTGTTALTVITTRDEKAEPRSSRPRAGVVA